MAGGGAGRRPNLVLRRVREGERRETRAEFAEAMARVAVELGELVRPDERYVGLLESGAVVPGAAYRRVLAELCGRPAGELGFAGSGRAGYEGPLWAAMEGKGLDEVQLARRLGVDPKTVQRWVTRGRLPHPRYRWEVSRVLGVPERELWPGVSYPWDEVPVPGGEVPGGASAGAGGKTGGEAVDDGGAGAGLADLLATGAVGEVVAGDGEAGGAGRRGAAACGGPGGDRRVSSDQVPAGTDDVMRALLRVVLAAGLVRGDVLDVDDVERREFFRVAGGVAVSAPLMAGGVGAERVRRSLDGALNAPTTGADVAEWERVAAQYSAESGLVAPAVLLPELLTDLDEAQTRLKGSPDALRAPMARVCGYLGALAAINFFNAGDEGSARRYWRTALRVIGHADDRPVQAGLYGLRAVFALDDGSSPQAALAIADDVVRIAGETPCTGAARGHVARATALALLGEHSESTRALGDLADTFTRLPDVTPGSRGTWGYSEQELRFTESRVYSYAGRASDAAKSWEAGRALVPGNAPLGVAAFEIGRATGIILDGDPSEGARHVVRTIRALPSGYQESATLRWKASRALDAVPVGAAGVPAVVEARELLALPPGAKA